MKMLNKFLLIVTIFFSSLNAEEGISQFIAGTNNSTTCESKCPPLKDGYIGRIIDFNLHTGTTSCLIYSLQDIQHPVGKAVSVNNHCAKALINDTKVADVNSNTTAVNSHLFDLKDRMNDLYTNTGAVKYLNLPKYMVAGLMADSDIVDIPASITTNSIVLNGGYSNAPNMVNSDLQNPTLVSRTKDALSGSVTFMINFLSLSDKTLLSLKVMLWLFVSVLGVTFAISQKATKKISKISDHEDTLEKVLFGVVSLLFFFFSTHKVEVQGGQISQTAYQQMIRPFMYKGIEIADKLTETATSSVLKYKFASVGLNVKDDYQGLRDLEFQEKLKNKWYAGQLKECKQVYNTDSTQHYIKMLNSNTLFPPSETIKTKDDFLNGGKKEINFYTLTFINNEADLKKTDIPAISYCYQVERAYYESNASLKALTTKATNYNSSISTGMETKINQMVDLTYKNIQDFGFISIVNLGTTVMAFDTFNLFGWTENDENYQETYEMKLSEFRNQSGYEIQGFAHSDSDGTGAGMIGGAINDVLTNAPVYMLFPFSNQLQTYVNQAFKPLRETADVVISGISMFVGKFPFGGSMFADIIQKVGTTSMDFIMDSLTNQFVMYIIKTTIAVIPLIAIICAGLMSIAYYFLSVEILYIVIPFASIFAFSTGNLDILKKLIKHTFILMVKPVLIVVSILMAIFIYSMLQSLMNVMISNMVEPLFLMANNLNALDFNLSSIAVGLSGLGAGAIIVVAKSILGLVFQILTIFICFYIALSGANLILDMLGIRENGFDVGDKLGEKLSEKGSTGTFMTPTPIKTSFK